MTDVPQDDAKALDGIREDHAVDFKMTPSGYHRQIGRLLKIIDRTQAERDEVLEQVALAVAKGCTMCVLGGCEYCGPPQRVIRSLKAVKS